MPQDISLLFYSIKELYDTLKFENKFDKHETSVGAFIVSFHCSLIFSSSMFVLCFVLCFRRIPYSCWSVILSLHFMNLFFYNIVYRSVKLSIQNFPSEDQQSRILNGFGPQSIDEDLSITGQWSEKFLGIVFWELAGHLVSHSGDTRNLSNLLLAVPFGLNQVN